MEVLAHPDPFVLEDELLRRVGAAQARDALAPLLVLVPTRRLANHVQRRVAQRHRARLGVHVLHYRALAFRILEASGAGRPRLLSPLLREALLGSVLEGLPPNPWGEFLARRPGALGGLLGALDDLREAGISPEAAAEALREGEREAWLARIHAAWVEALESPRARGLVDEAGLLGAASAAAEAFARRTGLRAVLHHGAYELIGIHLELLRRLDRVAEVAFLLPAEPGAPATRYAERFAAHHLLQGGGRIRRLGDRPGGMLASRLSSLYVEDAAFEPLAGERVAVWNAQGAAAELTVAARRSMAAVAQGVPPEEVAVVARTLVPYAGALDPALGPGIPRFSSARLALRRHPAVHDLLVLLRASSEDFPRAATVEILRSPRVRWDVLGAGRPDGERAEVWSREARLLKGLGGWTRDLPEWAGAVRSRDGESDEDRARAEEQARARRRQAERMALALERLVERLRPGQPGSWSDHAGRLDLLVREVLPGAGEPQDDPSVAALRDVLGEMRALDQVLEARGPVPFREAAAWLEWAVDRSDVPAEAADRGGIRILDAMQARGLTFERVSILGMNEGVFPRVPRDDPFLSPAARRRLEEATGAPVPGSGQADDEERLLLLLMLGSARGAIDLSWQRADETGKSRTPSLALREVARLLRGTPDLAAVVEGSRRLPAHPRAWLEALAADPGLLADREEQLLLALRSTRPEAALEALGPRDGGLVPSLEMLRETESFAPGAARYDARIGPGLHGREHHSPSSLERLARCPLSYFFAYVLAVRELEEEVSLYSLEPREMGSLIHELLRILYGRLATEGSFARGDARALAARARELLPGAWEEAMRPLRSGMATHLPLLWRWQEERWKTAVAAFLEEDLPRIAAPGRSLEDLEALEVRALDLGGGVRASFRGRYDRRLAAPEGPIVGDYKTSKKLADKVDVTKMLKGEALQVPLYWMMNGERGAVELLGIGPTHFAPESEPGDRRAFFDGFDDPTHLEGLRETLRVLLALAESGCFPLNPGHHCGYCDYRQACRQSHPPTRERESHAPDAGDYRGVLEKNKTRRPLLHGVRPPRGRRR